MEPTDEELMAQYGRGDAEAFCELVSRHEQRLWNFLRRYVGDAATAQDLHQEVLLRIVRGAPDWRPQAKFTTWMYTIARNLCTDHARRKRHPAPLSLEWSNTGGLDESGPKLLNQLAGSQAGGEARTSQRQLLERLDQALANLPAEQREVFILREVSQLRFAEIAEAVGVSQATVKSRLRYALQRLRDALSEFRASTPLPFVPSGGMKP